MKYNSVEEKVLAMRYNEFGFEKIHFLGSDKDVFPFRFHVVKYEKCAPYKVFSVELQEYILSTSHSYAIAELTWDVKEGCWELRSLGLRYLEVSDEYVNKWILDFCNKFYVEEGELLER